jgi:REP element-mobilizing transposase RayT
MRTRRTDLVHRLAYSWTGRPKSEPFPPAPSADFLANLDTAWHSDGLLRLAHRWQPDLIQFTFEAPPHISPEFVAARTKGRLDHALRKTGWSHGFVRNVALRSLGENTLDVVLRYIATQLDRAELADPRYVQSLAQAAWTDGDLDLAEPLSGGHGRYWYNLHLVAVTERRWRIGREDFLPKIPGAVCAWGKVLSAEGGAGEHRPGVHSLAVMPDHVHLSVRGPSAWSPDQIAGSLRDALNRAAGCRLFDARVYAGTFSTYPLSHIRSR